jgi:hypothetical protein
MRSLTSRLSGLGIDISVRNSNAGWRIARPILGNTLAAAMTAVNFPLFAPKLGQ